MPRRLLPLPASISGPVFTAAEARAAGISGGRLRAADVSRIDRGLYVRTERSNGAASSPESDGTPHEEGASTVREADVIRALQRADPDAVACGLSAARLWNLPLPLGLSSWDADDPDSTITMSLTGFHRLNTKQVTWRSSDISSRERARLRGIGTTTRLRTFLELAEVLPQDDLVEIGDHLVRMPRPSLEGRSLPHVPIDELSDVVVRFRGRGSRRLRSAMADVRVGADSPQETFLRLALLRSGLPEPVLNTTIRQDGRWLGEPDMSWPQWKVCLEYDGRHHRSRTQQEKDILRGERRRLAGWTELVVSVGDMDRGAARAIERVTSELRRRGHTG
ncbi:hypothetical protein ACFWQK_06470 [Brachybacterium paraconglomeratum]